MNADPTANCEHWGHEPGDWKWSCCACSGLPNGCDNCTEYEYADGEE